MLACGTALGLLGTSWLDSWEEIRLTYPFKAGFYGRC
jgi:hypothetical protein